MASHEKPRSHDDAARALVYVPCPACGRAVQLSDDHRVANDADAYECPNCGARMVVSET
ncbi:MAG TPA: hypothetical protein VGW30_00010 [Gaiellaceae bacterium]|nr:hypothetical protein [Gaiellaceae bacterium]